MDKELVFLVVLDNSDEVLNALRYASQRSSINNGRVALLYTFETLEFSHWKAVEDIAEVESRKEAESKIKEYENFVMNFTQKSPKKYLFILLTIKLLSRVRQQLHWKCFNKAQEVMIT